MKFAINNYYNSLVLYCKVKKVQTKIVRERLHYKIKVNKNLREK